MNLCEQYSLCILDLVEPDSQVKKWHVKTKKNDNNGRDACEFNQISRMFTYLCSGSFSSCSNDIVLDDRTLVISSPQGIETDRPSEKLESGQESLRRIEGELVTLRCLIKPEQMIKDSPNTVQWEYSSDGKSYALISMDDVEVVGDKLTINEVKKIHRGYYQCTLNNISYSVLLRVKSKRNRFDR
jgi:hypothetical protein